MVFVKRLAVFCLAALLIGCTSLPPQELETVPAKRRGSNTVRADVTSPIDIYDPFERLNRTVYKFNAKFDQFVFLPVVTFYATITPNFIETGISNFFSNLSEIGNFSNSVFQLKAKSSMTALGRFVVNSTIGMGGLWDVAAHMGIHQQDEDFGQTLGHYGVGDGPFLVVPILGPSNVRDTAGLAVDASLFQFVFSEELDPFNFNNHIEREVGFDLLRAINARHNNDFRYFQTGSPFEYDLVRLLYTKKRQLEIAK